MSGQTLTRRAAIAACGAFALVTAMPGGTALAQSRVAVGAIRVDVAPLRAAAGDPTATWVEQELPRQLAEALSGRLTPKGATLIVRINSLTIGPNKDSRAWDNISGVATIGGVERPVRATSRYWASAIDAGDDRAIQSCPCFGGGAGARVLDCARFLIRPVGSWFPGGPGFGSLRSRQITPPLAPAPTCARSRSGLRLPPSAFGALALAFFDPESQCDS